MDRGSGRKAVAGRPPGESDATVTAEGQDAKAGQSLATVHGGSEIHGKVKQTVRVSGSAAVLAKGSGAKACQALGTVGDNPACK